MMAIRCIFLSNILPLTHPFLNYAATQAALPNYKSIFLCPLKGKHCSHFQRINIVSFLTDLTLITDRPMFCLAKLDLRMEVVK
jgi:hypothetical protein